MRVLLLVIIVFTSISARAQWNTVKLTSEVKAMKLVLNSYVGLTRTLATENLDLKIKVANLQMENLIYKSRIDTLETRVVTYSDDFDIVDGVFRVAKYNEVLTLIKRVRDLEIRPVQLNRAIQFKD